MKTVLTKHLFQLLLSTTQTESRLLIFSPSKESGVQKQLGQDTVRPKEIMSFLQQCYQQQIACLTGVVQCEYTQFLLLDNLVITLPSIDYKLTLDLAYDRIHLSHQKTRDSGESLMKHVTFRSVWSGLNEQFTGYTNLAFPLTQHMWFQQSIAPYFFLIYLFYFP